MFLQSDEMDISLEEIQGGKLCFRASNRSLPEDIWSELYD